MKTQFFRFILNSIVASLTCLNLAIASSSASSEEGAHFCVVTEHQPDNRRYARSSANLDVGEPYTVRLIYFLPSDSQPKPGIDIVFDTWIKKVQQYFADVMEYHGFGRKTFRFETDTTGKAVVHHVKGKFKDAYYLNAGGKVWEEIFTQFDGSKSIYLLALDISSEYLSDTEPLAGFATGNSLGGWGLIHVNEFRVADHELGHAFGLMHDRRTDAKRPTRFERMTGSFCAAEWLDVNRYFNTSQNAFNEDTSVEMRAPSLGVPPYGIRLQFEISDPDGLHQAQLFAPFGGFPAVIACKRLNGKSTTVEIVTTELIGGYGIILRVIDLHGNFTEHWFPIDIAPLLPLPEVISIPDPNLAAAVRETLSLAPSDAITQLDMLSLTDFWGVGNRQITELSGLENAFHLRSLGLWNNDFHDIASLVGLNNLQSLDISYNSISDITPLTGLENLRFLGLSGNQIREITALAGLKNLWYLSLGDNQISNVNPLKALTELRVLYLLGNNVSDISPLVGNTGLGSGDTVDIKVNPLSYASIYTHIPALQERGVAVTFDPRTPQRIRIVSGNDQKGMPGAALDKPLVVEILDQKSDVFEGVPVTFSVTTGGGTLSITNTTTDANGREESTLTLGPNPGTNTVTVSVTGIEEVQTFTAEGIRITKTLEIISGDDQEGPPGAALENPFIVEVRDQTDEPLPDVQVMFTIRSGGGTLSVTNATTDSNGRAESILTLGSNPGTNTVTVSVTGIQEGQTFSAEGIRIPKTLEIISGNDQEGLPGAALEKPFVVEVRDRSDKPLPGVEVTFSVTSGGGTLSATSATTDSNGRAESTLTLGPNPGTNTVTVSVTGIQGEQTFNAEGIRIPKRLEIISGKDQEGQPGAALENPFIVEVRDQSDKPLPGIQVTFSVSSGGGALSATSVTTDSNGRAESILTLGPNPGRNTVTVSVTGIQEQQTFTVEGIRIPETLDIVSGNDQEGQPGAALENPFVVEVRDQSDKPLPGAQVTFSVTSGGGTLSATNVTTNSNGRAESRLTLGPNPGTNTVTVSVTGITRTEMFNAEGIRIPKTLEIVSGDSQEGQPGAVLERPFVVEVRDQTDKPLPGAQVTFAVSSGGGTLSVTSTTTGSNGRTESTLTLGPNLGTNTVTVSVTGSQDKETFNAEGIRIPLAFWIISGDKQQGLPGEALANLFVVEVRDKSGEPLPDVQVTFSVSIGGGMLNATSVTTDSNGRVESTLTLGPNPGPNTVTVSVTGIQEEQTVTAIAEPPPIPQDVNRDDVVNILDLVFVASALGDEGQGLVADVNEDGIVNILDLVMVAGALGNGAAAPSVWYRDLEIAPTRAEVGQWLAQAGEVDLRDATSRDGVLFLKQLLAVLIPKETALLPNYPNPFNPETWIPYRLAEDWHVTMTIYDTNGVVVRRLDMGHQSAGFYTSRGKAAYWDGRNNFGEGVASGVYFYHLSAGDYSATRKMLVVK